MGNMPEPHTLKLVAAQQKISTLTVPSCPFIPTPNKDFFKTLQTLSEKSLFEPSDSRVRSVQVPEASELSTDPLETKSSKAQESNLLRARSKAVIAERCCRCNRLAAEVAMRSARKYP